MVAVPHFMRERRKHSQTIVWLCHRKLFLRRIVLHLQTPLSSTSLCLKKKKKSCCARCHGNWATGIVRVTGVWGSPGRREPSWGGDTSPSTQCDFYFYFFPFYLSKSEGSWVPGEWPAAGRRPIAGQERASSRCRQPALRRRGAGVPFPQAVACHFARPKTSGSLSLGQGDVANKRQTAKAVSQDGNER